MRLVRLSNSVPAAVLVLIGAKLVGVWPPIQPVWLAAAAMWCVTAFGYASNDLFDVAEDRINKPDRPLPSGAVKRWEAQLLAAVLAAAALGISALLGWLPTTVAATVMLLLTLYNWRLKGRAAQGNLLIALLAGCTFLVGGISAKELALDTVQPLLIPAVILAFFVVTREMLKTIEDEAGDEWAGKETVTTRWDRQTALVFVTCAAIATVLVIQVPYILGRYSIYYWWIAMTGVAGPLLYTILYLWQRITLARVQRCLALLKGSYFAGLIALWLA